MQETYYIDKLYPFQDEILKIIEDLNLDFYLTGGTALGRCYLNHRYSDDLDFFVNDFSLFSSKTIKNSQLIAHAGVLESPLITRVQFKI